MNNHQLRLLTLQLLRTFIAVAETRQMTLAASRLHITQSAVSQQIKKLEMIFDTSLINRQSEEITLTHGGERLISRAYKLVAQADALFNDMQTPDYSSEIRLGVPTDIVSSLLPNMLNRFKNAHPQVLITLVSDVSDHLRSELEVGAIDIALLTESQRGSEQDCLISDTLVWTGVKDSQLPKERPLSVALGNDNCAFRSATTQALNRQGIAWRAVCQMGGLEAVFATLKAEMAIGAFLSATVPDNLHIINDNDLPELPKFHINIKRGANSNTSIAGLFIQHLTEEFKQLKERITEQKKLPA